MSIKAAHQQWMTPRSDNHRHKCTNNNILAQVQILLEYNHEYKLNVRQRFGRNQKKKKIKYLYQIEVPTRSDHRIAI